MQFLSKASKIDFMSKRKIAVSISAVLFVLAIVSLSTKGLSLGLDFTGGTLIELGYEQAVDLKQARESLDKAGFKGLVVQNFGTSRDIIVRIAPQEGIDNEGLSAKIIETLKASSSEKIDIRRIEFVGPQVGEELTEEGGLAVLYALICIFIYVFLRFEWRFAVGSVAALFHDVVLTLGIFSVLQLDFDLTVLAACLAVIGYSLNDTIVVFDRIRENFRKMRKGSSVEIVNASLNQTLARTLVTSLTTLLVLTALFAVGGELIHGFATALIIGVLVGTYSSIYIASTSVLLLGISKQDLMPVKKEGVEDDGAVV